jgi:hypothetical protein
VVDIFGDIKSKVELTLRVALWGTMAAASATVGVLFLLIALFLWLADRYDVVTACVVLGLLFVMLALAGALGFALTSRRAEVRSLQRRTSTPTQSTSTQWWHDPRVLAGGLEIVRLLGTRRTTLLLVAAMASGFLLSKVQQTDNPGQRDD